MALSWLDDGVVVPMYTFIALGSVMTMGTMMTLCSVVTTSIITLPLGLVCNCHVSKKCHDSFLYFFPLWTTMSLPRVGTVPAPLPQSFLVTKAVLSCHMPLLLGLSPVFSLLWFVSFCSIFTISFVRPKIEGVYHNMHTFKHNVFNLS